MTPDRTPSPTVVPSWAGPHIPEAVGAGALVVVSIVLAWVLL